MIRHLLVQNARARSTPASFLAALPPPTNNNNENNNNITNQRSFHTTTKREILPFIAVGAVGVIGFYSFRALRRMNNEKIEYKQKMIDLGLATVDENYDR